MLATPVLSILHFREPSPIFQVAALRCHAHQAPQEAASQTTTAAATPAFAEQSAHRAIFRSTTAGALPFSAHVTRPVSACQALVAVYATQAIAAPSWQLISRHTTSGSAIDVPLAATRAGVRYARPVLLAGRITIATRQPHAVSVTPDTTAPAQRI